MTCKRGPHQQYRGMPWFTIPTRTYPKPRPTKPVDSSIAHCAHFLRQGVRLFGRPPWWHFGTIWIYRGEQPTLTNHFKYTFSSISNPPNFAPENRNFFGTISVYRGEGVSPEEVPTRGEARRVATPQVAVQLDPALEASRPASCAAASFVACLAVVPGHPLALKRLVQPPHSFPVGLFALPQRALRNGRTAARRRAAARRCTAARRVCRVRKGGGRRCTCDEGWGHVLQLLWVLPPRHHLAGQECARSFPSLPPPPLCNPPTQCRKGGRLQGGGEVPGGPCTLVHMVNIAAERWTQLQMCCADTNSAMV